MQIDEYLQATGISDRRFGFDAKKGRYLSTIYYLLYVYLTE